MSSVSISSLLPGRPQPFPAARGRDHRWAVSDGCGCLFVMWLGLHRHIPLSSPWSHTNALHVEIKDQTAWEHYLYAYMFLEIITRKLCHNCLKWKRGPFKDRPTKRYKPWSCHFRYRLTKIAVDTAAGPYQNHTVVFLGSEKGIILKFLARIGNSGFLNDSLFLEEMNVYNPEKYVESLALS